MARRRRLSEATLREDATIVFATSVIAARLAERHPDLAGLVVAARLLEETRAEMIGEADALAAKPADAPSE